jgi:hypothetical protein
MTKTLTILRNAATILGLIFCATVIGVLGYMLFVLLVLMWHGF